MQICLMASALHQTNIAELKQLNKNCSISELKGCECICVFFYIHQKFVHKAAIQLAMLNLDGGNKTIQIKKSIPCHLISNHHPIWSNLSCVMVLQGSQPSSLGLLSGNGNVSGTYTMCVCSEWKTTCLSVQPSNRGRL